MDIEILQLRQWILLPGTLCNGEVFTAFLDTMGVPEINRHVIGLHYPHVDDYAIELERVTNSDAVICGFSLGAIVAANLVDRLTASALFLFGLNPFADDPAKEIDRRDLENAVLTEGGHAAFLTRIPEIHGPTPLKVRNLILKMAEAEAQNIAAQTTLALTRPSAMYSLAAAKMPIFTLTGTNDSSAPLSLARSAAEIAPKGVTCALPNLGHYALLEDPTLCKTTLVAGLNQ